MLPYGILFAHIGVDIADCAPARAGCRHPRRQVYRVGLGFPFGAWLPRVVGVSVPDQTFSFSLELRSLKRQIRANVPGSRAVVSANAATDVSQI